MEVVCQLCPALYNAIFCKLRICKNSQFAITLGCKEGALPLKYLGLPIGAPFKATNIWLPFIEKLENRLATWRRNSLSKGGRLVLIKSCLLSIPIYYLSLFPIPVMISQRMERLVRSFLWGGSNTRRPFCSVRWENVSKPKEFGGLGIRSFLRMNSALCSKWVWRYSKEKHALWRQVVKARHGSEKGDIFPKPPRGSHGMGVWKNICRQVPFVHSFSSFEVGDGHSVRFWMDKWCSQQPLRFIAPNLFRIVMRKHSAVSEVMRFRNNQYQIYLSFYHAIDYHFMHEVALVHNAVFSVDLHPSREDVLVWGDTDEENEGFSVSNAYDKFFQPLLLGLQEFPCHCVWVKGVPLKVQFFIWLAVQNRISTIDLLQRRGILWVNRCSLCLAFPESASHLLIHCGYAFHIWTIFLRSFNVCWVQPGTFMELLLSWSFYKGASKGKMVWALVPHAIGWCLWIERNRRCYEGVEATTMKTVLSVRSLLGYWTANLPDFKDLPADYFLFNFDRISVTFL